MKINLKQEYNNVKIKDEDEQKAAFTTPERSFEPTVMFFGLTNLPATFQAIMNKLLRDLINTEKVRSFIDGIMVETEIEEENNKLVMEILRRLEENNLYVKPEKCKQKVREVDFLESSVRARRYKYKGSEGESSIELASS